jgi:hypothetical protein
MGGLIGNLIPIALGVAISVIPIIAVIMMLFSARAKVNSILFNLGWVLAMAAIGLVGIFALGGADYSADSGPSTSSFVVQLVLGVLFFGLALRKWRKKPAEGEEEMPKWIAKIDDLKPAMAFLLGLALIAINPKNLMLTLAAVANILEAEVGAGQSVVALVFFIFIASLTVAAPVVIYLAAPNRSQAILTSWKKWLTSHNRAITIGLFVVLGVLLAVKGIVGLA